MSNLSRLYHIVAINEKSGQQVVTTSYPLSHDSACALLIKFSSHKARRLMLVEVPVDNLE